MGKSKLGLKQDQEAGDYLPQFDSEPEGPEPAAATQPPTKETNQPAANAKAKAKAAKSTEDPDVKEEAEDLGDDVEVPHDCGEGSEPDLVEEPAEEDLERELERAMDDEFGTGFEFVSEDALQATPQAPPDSADGTADSAGDVAKPAKQPAVVEAAVPLANAVPPPEDATATATAASSQTLKQLCPQPRMLQLQLPSRPSRAAVQSAKDAATVAKLTRQPDAEAEAAVP